MFGAAEPDDAEARWQFLYGQLRALATAIVQARQRNDPVDERALRDKFADLRSQADALARSMGQSESTSTFLSRVGDLQASLGGIGSGLSFGLTAAGAIIPLLLIVGVYVVAKNSGVQVKYERSDRGR